MSIEQWSESILVVELQDDPAFSDDLLALVDDADAKNDVDIVLNFGSVTYLNSSNIARLLKLRKKVSANKRKLVIITNATWDFCLAGLND